MQLTAGGHCTGDLTDYMRKPPDPKCWCGRSLIGTDSNYTSDTGNPALPSFKNAAVLPNDVWILPPTGAPRPLISDLPSCECADDMTPCLPAVHDAVLDSRPAVVLDTFVLSALPLSSLLPEEDDMQAGCN